MIRVAVLAALTLAAPAFAQAHLADPAYADAGQYNSQGYAFTASSSGELMGYFVSKGSAIYNDEVGVLDDGKLTANGFGLDNQSSSLGQSFDFGYVSQGDTLTFVLQNNTLGKLAYSNAAMNSAYDDGSAGGRNNHVFSKTYTAATTHGVLSGTYVAFEDMSFPHSDYNYDDDAFVFTSTAATNVSAAPEPSSWLLMVAGIGGVGAMLRRAKRKMGSRLGTLLTA